MATLPLLSNESLIRIVLMKKNKKNVKKCSLKNFRFGLNMREIVVDYLNLAGIIAAML
jgi:hypothetical protein